MIDCLRAFSEPLFVRAPVVTCTIAITFYAEHHDCRQAAAKKNSSRVIIFEINRLNSLSVLITATMLKGISPLISPGLLEVMARMGHGDELVLADAHFPGESLGKRVVRADGLRIADLLEAILPLYELDSYVPHPLIMMEPVAGDTIDQQVEINYLKSIRLTHPDLPPIKRIDRYAFYERAKSAFAVVMTGETAKYGNIILIKGVIPI
jgi:L-fucose mutarotase